MSDRIWHVAAKASASNENQIHSVNQACAMGSAIVVIAASLSALLTNSTLGINFAQYSLKNIILGLSKKCKQRYTLNCNFFSHKKFIENVKKS